MTIPGASAGNCVRKSFSASVPPVLAPTTTIFSVVSIGVELELGLIYPKE